MEWEYKTIVIKAKASFWGGKFDNNELDNILNKYGEDGWELVNVVASNQAYGESGSLICIFKREI